MTTRTPLCTVKGCPEPKNPDFHIPICGHGLEGHHHHVTKRSQGGKDGPQVFICPDCHNEIDNGLWGNAIQDIPGVGKVYRVWTLKNETVFERVIGESAGGEEVGRTGLVPADFQQASHAAEAGTSPAALSSPTHEQRIAILASIRDAQERRQFRAGDTANAWEKELGEDFWNLYANEFGYTYPSLRNAMRVCKAIPASRRHHKMGYSHHICVYRLDVEAQEAWLERAYTEEWTVSQMREEMRAEGLLPQRAKIRRWDIKELRELEQGWRDRTALAEGEAYYSWDFLDILEATS